MRSTGLTPKGCTTHLASWSRQLYRFRYSTRNLEIPLTRVVQSRFPLLDETRCSPARVLCLLRTKISLSSFRQRTTSEEDLSATLHNEVMWPPPPLFHVEARHVRFPHSVFPFFPKVVVSRRSALKIRNKTRRAVAGGKAILWKMRSYSSF